jgi:hypothetical protein
MRIRRGAVWVWAARSADSAKKSLFCGSFSWGFEALRNALVTQ